jgi:hypothetical protein
VFQTCGLGAGFEGTSVHELGFNRRDLCACEDRSKSNYNRYRGEPDGNEEECGSKVKDFGQHVGSCGLGCCYFALRHTIVFTLLARQHNSEMVPMGECH